MGVFYAHLVLLTAGVGTAAPLSVCSLLFPCAFCVVDTGLGRLSHDATPLTPRGTRAGVLSTQCAEDLCPLREHIRVSARVTKSTTQNCVQVPVCPCPARDGALGGLRLRYNNKVYLSSMSARLQPAKLHTRASPRPPPRHVKKHTGQLNTCCVQPLYTSQPKSKKRALKNTHGRNFCAKDGCASPRTGHTVGTNTPHNQKHKKKQSKTQ